MVSRVEGDDGALLDGPAGRTARLRVAAAFAGLAVGVALAGAFLLPRLRADVPVRPVDPAPGVIVLPASAHAERCPARRNQRVAV